MSLPHLYLHTIKMSFNPSHSGFGSVSQSNVTSKQSTIQAAESPGLNKDYVSDLFTGKSNL
jgi:hypothetical protein